MSYNYKLNIVVGIDEGLVPESKLPAIKMLNYMVEEQQTLKLAALKQETAKIKPNSVATIV